MRKAPLLGMIGLVAGFLLNSLPPADAQRHSYGGRLQMQQLVRRIDELERRVAELEGVRPVEQRRVPSLSVEDAAQYVAAAQQRHDYSEKLLRKGYISRAEYEADRFEFDRARKVLELAQAVADGGATTSIDTAIENLDAEYHWSVAKRQLELVEKYAAQGFKSPAVVEGHRKAVDDAYTHLEQVRSKLSEAK